MNNTKGEQDLQEEAVDTYWHNMSPEDCESRLRTDKSQGLTSDEVQKRLDTFGPNSVTSAKHTGPLRRLLNLLNQPLIYILLVASAVTAIMGEWVDSSVILGVVVVNTLIAFVQEAKAEKAIAALQQMVTTTVTVLRDGEKQTVDSAEIVPGDVVLLQSGDKVPGDIRIVHARDLKIDESALTGESVPVEKKVPEIDEDTVVADRINMAYAGTLVTFGHGKGLIVGTGDATETGKIAHLVSETVEIDTPLTRRIKHFSKLLVYVILALAIFTFIVGVITAQPVFEMFLAAVALAVAAIPEGLPAVMSIILAIGVRRMAVRKAIIRKLPAVETLGSTTVICSDKTGTLTQNQMTVQHIYAGSSLYDIGGSGYEPTGDILYEGKKVDPEDSVALTECIRTGYLCNNSRLGKDNGRWGISGDPTEGALIVAAVKAGVNEDEIKKKFPRLDEIPFESERQYMATLHKSETDDKNVIYLKGSVEQVLDRCSDYMCEDGKSLPLSHDEVSLKAEELAGKGLRVLAFALKYHGNDSIYEEDVESGMTFLGLQAMIDPPRPEAVKAVRECLKAGIKVKMITGDHALTAVAIARKMGINTDTESGSETPGSVTGRELLNYTKEELPDIAENNSVFARVAPEQKLNLVDALQFKRHVVAMTGDGVNDAPALKQADIGIAMGIAGTDVAKESSDMVLTDDNFASIEAAVEEGRGVFDNLTKFIVWTLPVNAGESLVILAALVLGVALPLLPVQVLWVNMTCVILLGMMLAFEPKEPGIMERVPRSPNAPILNRALIMRILLVGGLQLIGAFGLFNLELWKGASIEEARTVAVNVLIMGELFYLYNCRSLDKSVLSIGIFTNPWAIVGSVLMIIIQIGFTYLSFMNTLFNSAPITIESWIKIFGVSLVIYFIVAFEKWVRRKYGDLASA